MSIYLLDTSALTACLFKEQGAECVETLMGNRHSRVIVSCLSLFEMRYALKSRGAHEDDINEAMNVFAIVFEDAMAIDTRIVREATRLRDLGGGRLPAIDSLIAATARCAGATLVHRDRHFAVIPDSELRQHNVCDGMPPASPEVTSVARETGAAYVAAMRSKKNSARIVKRVQ